MSVLDLMTRFSKREADNVYINGDEYEGFIHKFVDGELIIVRDKESSIFELKFKNAKEYDKVLYSLTDVSEYKPLQNYLQKLELSESLKKTSKNEKKSKSGKV